MDGLDINTGEVPATAEDKTIDKLKNYSYLRAASSHNLANGDPSALDDAPFTGGKIGLVGGAVAGARIGATFGGLWGGLGGAIVGGATGYDWRTTAATTVAGLNSFTNSGINIINMLPGEDIKQADLHEWLGGADSDLSKYYDLHKEGIDTAAFIAGSIPAGMGAINWGLKALNMAGRAGIIGSSFAEATGFLEPTQAYFAKAAVDAAEKSAGVYKVLNTNALGAMAASAGEQALQGMLFEAGAQIAMNASPILSNQDSSDIASNMWTAAKWGAGFGAVTGLAGVTLKAVEATKMMDSKLRGAETIKGTQIQTTPSEEIASLYADQQAIHNFKLDTSDIIGATPEDTALKIKAYQDSMATKQSSTDNAIDNKKRTLWQGLVTSRDAPLANMVHEVMNARWVASGMDIDSKDSVMGMLFALKGVTRPGTLTKFELEHESFLGSINKGKSVDYNQYNSEPIISYLNLWGAKGVGAVTDRPKSYVDIWHGLAPGSKIEVKNSAVLAGKDTYTINLKKAWNPLEDTNVAAANARQLSLLEGKHAFKDGYQAGEFDFPVIERLIGDMNAGIIKEFKIAQKGGTDFHEIYNSQDALDYLRDAKVAVVRSLRDNVGKDALNDEQIASLINVKPEWVDGTTLDSSLSNNIMALQHYKTQYTEALKDVVGTKGTINDVLLLPQQAKLVHNGLDIHEHEALSTPFSVYFKQKQQLYQADARGKVATVLGNRYKDMIDVPEGLMRGVNRSGAGGGTIRPSDSNLGTAGSVFERVGQVFHKIHVEDRKAVHDRLFPSLHALEGDIEATAEYAAIMSKVGSSEHRFVLDENSNQLVNKAWKKYQDDIAKGKKSNDPGIAEKDRYIPIKSDTVHSIISEHTAINSERINKFAPIRSLGANPKVFDGAEVYAPPVDLRNYNHFAFVTDPTVTGTGAMKMIWAHDAESLERKLSLVPAEFQAGVIRKPNRLTGPEVDAWHKARGEYERDDSLVDNYFDAALNRTGAASDYLPPARADLIRDHLLGWHQAQDRNLLEETFGAYYAKEFAELESLGKHFSNIQMSKTSRQKILSFANDLGDNPYLNVMKVALDKPNTDKIPLKAFQDFADRKVSELWNAATSKAKNATNITDLDVINKAFSDIGVSHIPYDSLEALGIANHEVNRGTLSAFTRGSNAIIAGVGLGWDTMNAINNTVGSLVLLSSEAKYVMDAIKSSKESAGALKDIAHVVIPGTNGQSMLSPAKLISNAVKQIFNPEVRAWGESKGFSIRHISDVSDIIDTLAPGINMRGATLNDKLKIGFDKFVAFNRTMAKYTGNAHAEEFTRLTAALVMKQLTDIAVTGGHISESMADSYIQTFVNRTNGVYLASQRPMMFNGPIGQAMGLYQTYTITMANRFFQHMAEGSSKSAALMMAAQSSIYGMSGLPGFSAINTNIVGSFAGNTDHKDIYSVMHKAVDKDTADWLMFGALSNVSGLVNNDAKINMYVRGDVNPRNISIVPISPLDYPATQITAKFFGNLYNMGEKIVGGGAWGTTLLQGLEHNGLSRPLGGIAQVLEAATNDSHHSFATTNQGALIASHDLFSLVNLARLTGAKPLDEAKIMDESYRSTVYRAKKTEDIKQLGEAIKTKLLDRQTPTPMETHEFMREYIKSGGKQEGFNSYMLGLFKTANISQVNRMSETLKGAEAQKLQALMGGAGRYNNDFFTPEED